MLRVIAHAPSSAKRYSIEYEPEHAIAQLLTARDPRNRKPPLLEALREQAESRPIPVHELQVVAAAVDEDVQGSRQRILPERVLHQPHESVERLPHVDRVTIGEDPPDRRRPKHGLPAHPQHATVGELDLDRPERGESLRRSRDLDEVALTVLGCQPLLPPLKRRYDDRLALAELPGLQPASAKPIEDLPLLRCGAATLAVGENAHRDLLVE